MVHHFTLYWFMMQRRYDRRHFRLQMIHYAKRHGIKPTALAFGTTRVIVRKWLRRWDGKSLDALHDHRRAPLHPRRQLDPATVTQALELKSASSRSAPNVSNVSLPSRSAKKPSAESGMNTAS
jgi:hypothetical protein